MSQDETRVYSIFVHYYEIAIPAPLYTPLTYASLKKLSLGEQVTVPLRKKNSKGIVVSEVGKPAFEAKEIPPFEEENFILNPAHLDWLKWIADYYHYPIGLVVNSIFPPLPRKEKRKETEVLTSSKIATLTPPQEEALNKIKPLDSFKPHLLHGVTGSGKTEIYMELFDEVISKQGKQGLFLLPEISLTPQLEKRFIERFGSLISVYHSQLTPRQKTNSWYDFMEGKTKILIGPRSALFCPSENIGLIVVDEEHESSFKQEEKFLYHARDAALKLAHIKNIPIVLGSATPSLESLSNVEKGKYSYVRLKEKVFNQEVPTPQIVDMTKEKNDPFWLSNELKDSIENHLARKKQVALFLNRRGWASCIQCYSCGHGFKCLNCDVSLTLHNKKDLYCHYCGYGEDIPTHCPECSSEKISKIGLGTEQVFNDLSSIFPNARILKFDRDEIHTKNQLSEAVQDIEDHNFDIIIGTQMIAKGLDFTNLTLMGILDADQSLSFPDFRSSEKSLQQILQVVGRVGRRKEQQAEVIIQTRSPEHKIFENLNEKTFETFGAEQLKKRKVFNYPPFAKMVAFLVKAKSEKTGEQVAARVATLSNQLKTAWPQFEGLNVLGPCPAPIQKIRNEYRFQVILKFPEGLKHQQFVDKIVDALGKLPPQSKISINVDPVDLM
ncbi:MAG: replication restart helicase PriA [Bdellovibrionales bacterium]